MLSQAEENYLKVIFQVTSENTEKNEAGTNELAATLQVKPASVNAMLKKLKDKKLVNYEKYGKISLTPFGKKHSVEIIRKHRLWETFLYEKLEFTWDEVHEVAEQLEHINSSKLIEKLDKFLDYPEFDPHGDAIPNAKGEIKLQARKNLSQIPVGKSCKLIAVKNNTAPFLQYVVKVGLGLSCQIKIVSHQDFDSTIVIEVNGEKHNVSKKFAENLYVI